MGWLNGARVVTRATGVVVLVASGFYLLLYLYRWEWNRAQVAGLFFVAAEVGLVGAAIFARLRTIEARLPPPGAAPRDGAETPVGRRPFAWLEEASGGFGVFLPILLGAGVVLSLLAWVVEHLARFVTAPLARDHQVSHLARLDLPPGGLTGVTGGTGGTDGTGGTVGRPSGVAVPTGGVSAHRTLRVAVGLTAIVACVVGVWFLREHTESRPDGGQGGTTELDLRVLTRETGASVAQLVDALWVSCRLRLPSTARLESLEVTGPETATVVLSPALGRTDRRQFVGCVEDITIDRVNAWVTRYEVLPAR